MGADTWHARRRLLTLAARLGVGSLVPQAVLGQTAPSGILLRAIPSTGERVPAVGLGTAIVAGCPLGE